MSYNRLKSLAANVAAIETAVTVHKQRRKATQEEKQVLAQYSGFGGVKEVLTIGTQIPMPEELAEQTNRLQEVLRTLAGGSEGDYDLLMNSIKASVLTAFYTPDFLIEAFAGQIHTTFRENGLQMRSFLEPSLSASPQLPFATARTGFPETPTPDLAERHRLIPRTASPGRRGPRSRRPGRRFFARACPWPPPRTGSACPSARGRWSRRRRRGPSSRSIRSPETPRRKGSPPKKETNRSSMAPSSACSAAFLIGSTAGERPPGSGIHLHKNSGDSRNGTYQRTFQASLGR